MMITIRAHWKLVVGIVLVISVAVGSYCLISPAKAQVQTSAKPGLDSQSLDDIRQVRQALCLENQDLAAMGCSQQAASQILTIIIDWHSTNKTAINATKTSTVNSEAQLRELTRKINVGPYDPAVFSAVTQARAAINAALVERQQLQEALIKQVEATLTDSAKATWQAARQNRDLPTPYRYIPNLSPPQHVFLQNALAARNRDLSLTKTRAEANAARSTFASQQSEVLTAAQVTEMASTKTALKSCMAGVAQVSEAILVPSEQK